MEHFTVFLHPTEQSWINSTIQVITDSLGLRTSFVATKLTAVAE
jgi:hypothetical protein